MESVTALDVHLRDLRYFVTVADELHFTKAAQLLGIAQPTLSRQIRQLERQLGVALFDRDQRSVALTVAGAELLHSAQELLAMWDGISAGLQAAGNTLRVGLHTGVGQGLLAELASSGGQQLAPVAASWGDSSSGLAGHQADVALVWLPLADPARYPHRVLRREARWVLLPESHRLAGADTIDFADIAGEPFIALPATAGAARDFWLAADARGGHPARVGAEADNPTDQVEAVGLGLGLCLISAGSVPLYRWPGIAAREVTGLAPRELALAWRADEDRPAVLEFIAKVT